MKNATIEHGHYFTEECKKPYLQQSECLFEVQPSDGRGLAFRPQEERGLLGETLLLLLLPPNGAGFGGPSSPFFLLLHGAGGRCGWRNQAEGVCLTSGAENGSCGGLSRLYIDVSFSWALAQRKEGKKRWAQVESDPAAHYATHFAPKTKTACVAGCVARLGSENRDKATFATFHVSPRPYHGDEISISFKAHAESKSATFLP